MSMNLRTVIALVLLTTVSTTLVYGQYIKDFKLKSVTNKDQFSLHEAKGKYVALHFLLKTECPICLRHTQEYIINLHRLPDVVQVFIKPDTKRRLKNGPENLQWKTWRNFRSIAIPMPGLPSN